MGDAPTYNVSLTLHTAELVPELLAALRAEDANVTGLEGFAGSLPLPISWGEVLPLSFVAERAAELGASVAVMGVPQRRYDEDFTMVGELAKLGAAIGKFFAEKRAVRVAWVV